MFQVKLILQKRKRETVLKYLYYRFVRDNYFPQILQTKKNKELQGEET